MKTSSIGRMAFLSVLALALASCVSTKVSIQQPNDADLASANKIAFIKVKFAQRSLPVLPLLDAGIYNAAVNTAKPKLLEIENQAASEMSEGLARQVMDITQKDVALAKNPTEKPDFQQFDGNVSVPLVQSVAAENQADYVVAVAAQVVTSGVSALGIRGASYLCATMYVFDAQGKLRGKASFTGDTTTAGAQDLSAYQSVVNSWRLYGIQMVDLLLKEKAEKK